ncbi:hypothetical protein [Paenibacillus sp. SYP-B4298]|uniref:hypothetical protein n=1 Tax=Paenibacillus sp. SYP-B4298 TaxID=2996034 RepID=UPI0022DE3695|nr:hypothetical protein [Paenibacillus sp. SYP-B4298]
MSEAAVCPWCHSEIVWDPELGPEEHCPHCDNELDGYRTLKLNLDEDESDEDEYEEEDDSDAGSKTELYLDEEEQQSKQPPHQAILALEEHVQQLLNGQDDLPECPSCREYMIETGRQQLGSNVGYVPRKLEADELSLLPDPVEMVWYVCPSCFETRSKLSFEAQHAFARRLSAME